MCAKEVDLRDPSIALIGEVSVACVSSKLSENVVSLTGQKVSDGSAIPRPRQTGIVDHIGHIGREYVGNGWEGEAFAGLCLPNLVNLARCILRAMSEPAFCIYITTACEGPVPSVRDGNGRPCVFKTELEAQREIADNAMTRLKEFIDGEREFEDAMTVEEYVVSVDVSPDGSIVDTDGNQFGAEGN